MPFTFRLPPDQGLSYRIPAHQIKDSITQYLAHQIEASIASYYHTSATFPVTQISIGTCARTHARTRIHARIHTCIPVPTCIHTTICIHMSLHTLHSLPLLPLTPSSPNTTWNPLHLLSKRSDCPLVLSSASTECVLIP